MQAGANAWRQDFRARGTGTVARTAARLTLMLVYRLYYILMCDVLC